VGEAPALRIETREELVSLLYEAAELEHGLVCSYLFTAFTLKGDEGDGLTPAQAEAVGRWRDAITAVALEEMLHLALVSNLLTAVGAAPHMRRPPFPQVSRYYPAGITIELRRFSDATLTRFVHLERPEGVDIEEEVVADPAIDLEGGAPDAAPGALRTPDEAVEEVPAEAYATVGHLYQAIEDGIELLVERRGEDDVFIGPPRHRPRAPPSASPTSCRDRPHLGRRALEVLVTQGEGVSGDWTEAHYGRFLRVRDELRAMRASDPGFDPARPVLANPLSQAPVGGAPERLVTDPMSTTVMELFDGAYELMTTMLLRFFAHSDESDEALTTLVRAPSTSCSSPSGPSASCSPPSRRAPGTGAPRPAPASSSTVPCR
jgi:hypothetical protein